MTMVDSLAGITIISPLFACPVWLGLFAMKRAYINGSMCADLLAVSILATVAHILGAMVECFVDHGYLTGLPLEKFSRSAGLPDSHAVHHPVLDVVVFDIHLAHADWDDFVNTAALR